MSLQDEHLKQALKSAPDHGLAPSEAVRKIVLDYAQDATQEKNKGWLKRGFRALSHWQVKSWQLVGMSTVASVFLVMVMVRPQLPDESVWVNSDEQDIVLTEEMVPATAGTVMQEELAPPNKEEVSSPPVDGDLAKKLKQHKATDASARGSESISTKAKKNMRKEREVIKQRVDKVEEPVMDLSDKTDAVVAAPAPAESKPTSVVATDAVDELEVEDKAVLAGASGRMESTEAAEPSFSARKKSAPINENNSGIALAKKDIQLGNLRILFAGDSWPAGKPLVDEETGFRIELTKHSALKMLESEVGAYNQTMRDWHLVNQGVSN